MLMENLPLFKKSPLQRRLIFTVTNDLNYDQRMIRICSTLANNGYTVLLVGRQLPKSKPLSNRNFQQRRLKCWSTKGKFFYLEYNLRLLCFLFFNQFDALCSIDLDTLVPGYLVAKWKSKPLIYDAHEYFTEVPEVVDRPAIKKIWKTVESWIFPKLTFAYTVCESIGEAFEREYQKSFSVIRNVPFTQQNQGVVEKNHPPVIIYQGALNEGRGLEQAIIAMQWIDGALLWLVGEGDLSESLREQVRTMQLDDKVIFKGYQKPESLREITPRATIGLNLLANKGLSYYYSLANKAFDYVQAQVPALHMNFPEYYKLNQQYEVSLLLDTLEPIEIAKQINRLLSDTTLYNRLRENCIPAGRDWTWERESEKLLQFYDQVFNLKSKY
jgi:glycosyltransferase involved in cell wall biosynthesis